MRKTTASNILHGIQWGMTITINEQTKQ